VLHIGQPAPEFSLVDADMDTFELSSLRGRKHVVLFFYPRDDTPFCTIEAIDFSDHEDEFARLDCEILGVSRDDWLRHAEFRDKHGLSVRLLADDNSAVSHKYGVCHMREKDGARKLCVVSSTFIIDYLGVLRYALYDINPRGHAAEVLNLVKQLEKPCKSRKTPS
jgi:peroxiredoxin Q/BCP